MTTDVLIIPVFYPWLVHDQFSIALANYWASQVGKVEIVLCTGGQPSLVNGCELILEKTLNDCSNCKIGYIEIWEQLRRKHKKQLRLHNLGGINKCFHHSKDPFYAYKKKHAVMSTLFKHSRAVSKFKIVESEWAEEIMPLSSLYDEVNSLFHHFLSFLLQDFGDMRLYSCVFNARFVPYRSWYDACRHLSIDCIIHERGNRESSFQITQNIPVDDVYTIVRSALEESFSSPSEGVRERVTNYMRNRIEGKDLGAIRFSPNTTEAGIGSHSELLTIYTGSIDEKVPIIGRDMSQFYDDLFSSLAWSVERYSIDVAIRHHPNLGAGKASRRSAQAQVDQINLSAHKHLPRARIISPSEDVNSYILIQQSSYVCAPYSTVLLESLALGVKVITTKGCFYDSICHPSNIIVLGNPIYDIAHASHGSIMDIHENFIDAYLYRSSIKFAPLQIVDAYGPDMEGLKKILNSTEFDAEPVLGRIIHGLLDRPGEKFLFTVDPERLSHS